MILGDLSDMFQLKFQEPRKFLSDRTAEVNAKLKEALQNSIFPSWIRNPE